MKLCAPSQQGGKKGKWGSRGKKGECSFFGMMSRDLNESERKKKKKKKKERKKEQKACTHRQC